MNLQEGELYFKRVYVGSVNVGEVLFTQGAHNLHRLNDEVDMRERGVWKVTRIDSDRLKSYYYGLPVRGVPMSAAKGEPRYL